ncbi:MAG: ROK family protein [Spirochaetales bacterium]|nr:MAG: ROK family protein [Spirochaetales bacterium]
MHPGKPKTLKRNNRKAILNLLRNSGEMAVADISGIAGLSKTTVMKIVDYYVGQNIILQAGKGDSTNEGGKKPELFKFNEGYRYVFAVHIFPDEVFAALVDLKIHVVAEKSVKNREDERIETIVQQIASLAGDLMRSKGITGEQIAAAAVGAHGITNYSEGVVLTSPHFPSWGDNIPLKGMLQAALGLQVPLYVDNQIRFQVFAEKTFGAGVDRGNIIVIEGGEGLVAGIIMNNEIKRGVHYLAGEIGHMIINPEAEELCGCGGRGCFEVMVSTARMLEKAKQLEPAYPESQIFAGIKSDRVLMDSIFAASNKGDVLACSLMDEAIKWFTIGISNIILMYDPDIVIIQGVYAAAGAYFMENLRNGVNTCCLTHIKKNVEIQYSNLGRERGILGAAAFAVSEFFNEKDLYESRV